jgi:hypothetical protein
MLSPDHEALHTDRMAGLPWQLLACPGDDAVESTLYWDHGDGWEHQGGLFARLVVGLRKKEIRVERNEGMLAAGLPSLALALPSNKGWKTAAAQPWVSFKVTATG